MFARGRPLSVRRAKTLGSRLALERSLTQLRVFVLVSAMLLALGALVLGSLLTQSLRQQALEDSKVNLTQYANGVLGRYLVADGRVVVEGAVPTILERELKVRPEIISIKVWRPDGVLAWTSLAKERIGQKFPLGHHLEEVLESGEAEAEFESLGDEEDAAESRLGVDNVVEVYAPLVGERAEVLGAFEIYADSARLEALVGERKRVVWGATAGVFFALWALLVLLVRGASGRLKRQTKLLRARSAELVDAYRRLEESSLEAVESLNATVDAKDHYTAGHSLRVQRIALAIGEELGLSARRLDALRFGALFHDIGKVGVPDAILSKPARLTPEEFDVIKRHSSEGAHIVGKFGRLSEAVPIIRHHHERWTGGGYPDGIAGDDIPLEACIAGLADAWDAMTTHRPYHRALTWEEACEEVRQGRGTQFAPEVVDAFFAALRRRPSEFQSDRGDEIAAVAS